MSRKHLSIVLKGERMKPLENNDHQSDIIFYKIENTTTQTDMSRPHRSSKSEEPVRFVMHSESDLSCEAPGRTGANGHFVTLVIGSRRNSQIKPIEIRAQITSVTELNPNQYRFDFQIQAK